MFVWMQAGKFGIPQSRRRFILIGAAAGEILPHIPKPISIFSNSSLSLKLGNTIFLEEDRDGWSSSAPFRTIKIQDAISDLPPILSGDQVRLVSINYFKSFYLNTILFPNTSKWTYPNVLTVSLELQFSCYVDKSIKPELDLAILKIRIKLWEYFCLKKASID